MAEKLQSKVKLRSGEVITVDHVKPSKPASEKPKETKPKADTPADETQKSETSTSNEKPKETK